MNPFLLMTLLYLGLAILAALDASLTGFNLMPWFNGLRWLRIHFVTLGAVTEALLGLMPILVASRRGLPRPSPNWPAWLSLNVGLVTLAVGVPLTSPALMITGGTLVFVAVVLVMKALTPGPRSTLRPSPKGEGGGEGKPFYLAGMGYLLLGILVGSGLFAGWGEALRIVAPLEVHIHANNWGFMSLVFAGLLIDLFPRFSGRQLAWPRSLRPIFWLMTLGALLLVLGPWLGQNPVMAVGMLLHLVGTVWLLANVIAPLRGTKLLRSPGVLQLLTAYIWAFAPVLAVPAVLLGPPGIPVAGIEQYAPTALIYGWVLLFAYALIPFMARMALTPGPSGRGESQSGGLGGSWWTLLLVHLGAVLLWVGIFAGQAQAAFHAAAYAAWALSLVLILVEMARIFTPAATQPDTAVQEQAASTQEHPAHGD